ncbi:hypothetical protein L1887_01922 [Cichorium endivia]|nr:hypothetical protein L1887_01922 [Cichorium endivia]
MGRITTKQHVVVTGHLSVMYTNNQKLAKESYVYLHVHEEVGPVGHALWMILPFAELFLHPPPTSAVLPPPTIAVLLPPTIAAPSSVVAGFAVHNPNSSRERLLSAKSDSISEINSEISMQSDSTMPSDSLKQLPLFVFSPIGERDHIELSSIELVKEITSLETKIAHLERYLLLLYRTAFKQHVHSIPTNESKLHSDAWLSSYHGQISRIQEGLNRHSDIPNSYQMYINWHLA